MDIRPLTMGDAPATADLINRFERFWELPVLTPASEVEDDLGEPFVDPSSTRAGTGSRQPGGLRPRVASAEWLARSERS